MFLKLIQIYIIISSKPCLLEVSVPTRISNYFWLKWGPLEKGGLCFVLLNGLQQELIFISERILKDIEIKIYKRDHFIHSQKIIYFLYIQYIKYVMK